MAVITTYSKCVDEGLFNAQLNTVFFTHERRQIERAFVKGQRCQTDKVSNLIMQAGDHADK